MTITGPDPLTAARPDEPAAKTRRLQLSGGAPADARAGEVATREPKTISADDLAAKALEVMEAWAISGLIVVDADRRPIGVIHMHDILRAKIV